ncbi:hypothetical protein ACQY0O_007248 [Thecaphora frezii]
MVAQPFGRPSLRAQRGGGALIRLSLSLVLLCLVTLPTLTDAALFSPNTKVKLLDSSNFKREVLDIEKPTMVAFTAPWCGHCQRLVPEYEKAAKQLDGVVKLANIDCDDDKNKPICGQYGVQGFPTLKLFPPTKKRLPRDYQGPRTAKDIASYVVDTLPMGAKKLRAEELLDYCEKEPERPKVLLFSTKPTSSALYKSLALDFRKSISFAFLRGDQAPVRAASRTHLGIGIDEKELPVLLVVPGRADGASLSDIEAKRYDGLLKYHDLHQWLLDNVPEANQKKSTSKPKPKPKSKPKSKLKPKPKPSPKSKPAAKQSGQKKSAPKKAKAEDEDEDVKLPPGAQYEWKAENVPDSQERQEVLAGIAEKINKAAQRSREAASKGASDAAEAAENVYGDVKQTVFGSSDDGAEYREAKPASSSASHEDSESSGDETHTSSSFASSWSSSSSHSSFTDENGKTTEDTEASYHSSSSADPREHSYRVSSHRESTLGEDERASLKEQLTSWLDGQAVDWSSEYAEQFEKADAAAKELLEKDPEAAREAASKGEAFLLSHLETDLAMMETARAQGINDERIGDEKIEQVKRMVKEIKERLAQRAEAPRHEEL